MEFAEKASYWGGAHEGVENLCRFSIRSSDRPRPLLEFFSFVIVTNWRGIHESTTLTPVTGSIFGSLPRLIFLQVSSRSRFQILFHLISHWHYFGYLDWIHSSLQYNMWSKTFTRSLLQEEGFEIWGAPLFLITVVKGYCHRQSE